MQYRKEIDGLRAIAILPVIWLHAGLPYLGGGFLGVDVFFVISGFLITSILIKESNSSQFSIITFYERRVRRIIPALFVVLFVTILITPLIDQKPAYLEQYGRSLLSTLLFGSNIFFWQTSGYFGTTSELSPLLHTWSLAVEEQYYLFFPLFISLIMPRGKRLLTLSITFVCILSLALSQWGANHSPIANFYLLPTRAWELFSGALAAIYFPSMHCQRIRGKAISNVLVLIGLSLIIGSYIVFNASTSHPSPLTLIPVIGAVMVILFAHTNGISGQILANKQLVFIGLLSYSLYLWHQPILALLKKSMGLHLDWPYVLAAVVSTFLCSYLSWRFVEAPTRNKNSVSTRLLLKVSAGAAFILVSLSLLFINNIKFQSTLFPEAMKRYSKLAEAEESHSNQKMYDNGECKFWSQSFNSTFIKRFEQCASSHHKAILIMGGSHGMDLYNAFAINSNHPFVVSVSRGFCRIHQPVNLAIKLPQCQYQDAIKFVNEYSGKISNIFYTQTPDRLYKNVSMESASTKDLSLVAVGQVVEYLAKLQTDTNVPVSMFGMLPPLKKSPIEWDYKREFDQQYNEIIPDNGLKLTRYTDSVFKERLSEVGISYYPKIDAFSLQFPGDLIIEGNITYSDLRHISSQGERVFGKRMTEYLTQQGLEDF